MRCAYLFLGRLLGISIWYGFGNNIREEDITNEFDGVKVVVDECRSNISMAPQ